MSRIAYNPKLITAEKFISCDWGTSNFRLRLVETASLKVLKEIDSSDGIKKLNDTLGQNDRLRHFTDFLDKKIDKLPEKGKKWPVVISGMASSSIGMLDLPYANMPILANGNGLKSELLKTKSGLDIILISGLRTETNIMRGEEIQAVGLSYVFDDLESGILVLPGTHSKHIEFEKGSFVGFKTFMTGELFQLLTKQSILSASINQADLNKELEASFLLGVKLGLKNELSEHLFSVRVKAISDELTSQENYFYLSGLLIGDELSYLRNLKGNVVLAAPGVVYELYKTALCSFLPSATLQFIGGEDLEMALLKGHKRILFQHGSKLRSPISKTLMAS